MLKDSLLYLGGIKYAMVMQGSFEPTPKRGRLMPVIEEQYEDVLEDEQEVNVSNGQVSHLSAMYNVPWANLAPANDLHTQRMMAEHRQREVKYNVLTPNQKLFRPRVNPYPEAPDAVFPGTPCYRILTNGVSRFVFVLDKSMNSYPGGWDGTPKHQSVSWWIVPHFIYRNEEDVRNNKERWMRVYTMHAMNNQAPPDKFDFDSRILIPPPPPVAPVAPAPALPAAGAPAPAAPAAPAPAALAPAAPAAPAPAALAPAAPAPAPPPPVVIPGGVFQHDCYYAQGIPNNNLHGVPQIKDPLFSNPFNPIGIDHFIEPWPYNQPKETYPQQTAPLPVRIPVPAPVPGAPAVPPAAGALPGGAAPPAPAGAGPIPAAPAVPPAPAPPAPPAPPPAGRGRGRGRGRGGGAPPPPIYVQIPPHPSQLEALPPVYKGTPGVDWIVQNATNIEIDKDVLSSCCQEAEEMDYLFALTMQGLRGCSLPAVWTCIDPQYDVTDRNVVMQQFVKMYMERFYNHVSADGSTDVGEVVHEALRMHEEFCKGWVSRHHKTLSAEVTAMSEALLGMFYDDLKPCFPVGLTLTRQHLSRYMRRNPVYSGEFAHCLYHYMTSMEQIRGNKNPSYKAMNSEQLVHMNALRSMAQMLFNNLSQIKQELSTLTEMKLIFNKYFIDWHYIAGEMPQHHKEFDGFTNNFSLFRTRAGGRANPFPPWQQMRMVR